MQLTPQLMSKHHVLSFKPQLRLEWRGKDGQNETEQPDHSASLGDSVTSSTRIRFSMHTGGRCPARLQELWRAPRAQGRQAAPETADRQSPRIRRRGHSPRRSRLSPASAEILFILKQESSGKVDVGSAASSS